MIGEMYKNKFAVLFIAMALIVGLMLPACTCGEAAPPAEEAAPPAEEAAPPAEEAAPAEEEAATPEEEAAPPAEEEAAVELLFEPLEYVNEDYGFSIKYPDDWVPQPQYVKGDVIFSVGAPTYRVPAMTISVIEGTEIDDWPAEFTRSLEEDFGCTDVEVGPGSETTLADGTPAIEGELGFTGVTGSWIDGYYMGLTKGGNSFSVTGWTVAKVWVDEEGVFPQVAHTLEFK